MASSTEAAAAAAAEKMRLLLVTATEGDESVHESDEDDATGGRSGAFDEDRTRRQSSPPHVLAKLPRPYSAETASRLIAQRKLDDAGDESKQIRIRFRHFEKAERKAERNE